MRPARPRPIGTEAKRRRAVDCRRIALRLGFVGRVEYVHQYSRTGGAQYQQGVSESDDRLIVFAEAFESEFSLTAIIAHERGHQLFIRHPTLSVRLAGLPLAGEEVCASLLGAGLVDGTQDSRSLQLKALAELDERNHDLEKSLRIVESLYELLRKLS